MSDHPSSPRSPSQSTWTKRVEITERDKLPTAKEIEDRYDHTRHPSPLVT